jgi:hypothetical protein
MVDSPFSRQAIAELLSGKQFSSLLDVLAKLSCSRDRLFSLSLSLIHPPDLFRHAPSWHFGTFQHAGSNSAVPVAPTDVF